MAMAAGWPIQANIAPPRGPLPAELAAPEDELVAMLEAELAAEMAELEGPPQGTSEIRPLDETEVKSILGREIDDALGSIGSQISEDRRKALRFYFGRQFGNEVEGRSQVVLTDVADTIEWIMPSLMRIFTGGEQVVEYLPRRPGQEEQARQATDYVNHAFFSKMKGYMVLFNWFKTALIEKNGVVKTYYEERFEPKREVYRGMTEAEFQLLLNDGRELEVLAFDEYEDEATDPDGNVVVQRLFDAEVRVSDVTGQIRIDTIPPEEFLIARRAVELDDYVSFAAHRKKMTVSDLIALGFDPQVVENLPSDDAAEWSLERTERFGADETFPDTRSNRSDGASREVWTTECVIRLDEDGDGYAELRKILVAGEQSVTILDDQEINWQPFCSLTPIPVPHKFFGLSMADLVMDLQVIRSTILRQMLDNLYLVNNSRWEVVEGMVEIEDLLTSRPGGVVRVQAPDSVKPLLTQPYNQLPMQMMEFLEDVRSTRTGIMQYKQAIDATALNSQTATGVSSLMSAANARIELIARIFAETGVTDLFRNLLKLVVENPLSHRVIRLRGEWHDMDPSSWNTDMDVRVHVGLGVGQAAERIGFLTNVLQLQKEALGSGGAMLVKPRHVFEATSQLTHAMGFSNREQFFSDPGPEAEWPKPPPQPDVLEHERRLEDDRARRELDAGRYAAEAEKEARLADFRERELDEKMRVERERIAMEREVRMAVAQAARATKEAA